MHQREEVEGTSMADEGVEIVDCMFVKLGKEAVGRCKRDLKRRRHIKSIPRRMIWIRLER